MQSQSNQTVRRLLIQQCKQLQNHESASNFFMAYDFPDKQRSLKSFWQEIIQRVITLKRQIYVTYQDLQIITTIHKLKPLPLKKILVELKKNRIFVREEDLTQDIVQKKPKPWYANIMEFAWAKPNTPDFQWPFTFQPQQKIVATKLLQQKKLQLKSFLQSVFVGEHHARLMKDFMRQISLHIKVDEPSVEIIFKQMVHQKEIHLEEMHDLGDKILVYHKERKKMMDEKFIKVEKLKIMLQTHFQRLNARYDRSSDNITQFKQKAKRALLVDDKNKARMFVAQARSQQKHRQQIQVRLKIFQDRIKNIELNEMNISMVDAIEQAQILSQQIVVDSKKFDQVMQTEQEQRQDREHMNAKIQELAESEDIDDEVDKLLAEIEMDTRSKPKVEEKKVNVMIPQNNKDVEIDGPKRMFN